MPGLVCGRLDHEAERGAVVRGAQRAGMHAFGPECGTPCRTPCRLRMRCRIPAACLFTSHSGPALRLCLGRHAYHDRVRELAARELLMALANGFIIIKTKYGEGVSIREVNGLPR